MKLTIKFIALLALIGLLDSCKISYTVHGSTLDYTRMKTFTIEEFPNQAPLVYPPLSQMITESLRDSFDGKPD